MANHTTAPIGQSIKRKALLWAGYGPTSTDLHILCRMCTARGNAPLLPTASPPEGEILAALCLDVLMRSKAERRANFPLRGEVVRSTKRGAFPRAKPGCMVFRHYYHEHQPTKMFSAHSAPGSAGGKVAAQAPKGEPPEGCRKSMTQRFLATHPRCPLRGHRVYGAKRRCDTPLLSGPPIGGLLYFEFLSDSYPPAPLRHFVALFP